MFLNLRNKKNVYALVAVLTVTFISFSPSLRNDFLKYWDDGVHLVDYPLVRSLDFPNIKAIFHDAINEVYLPLTSLSFAVEYHFFKYNPFIYHLNNLILHLLIVALVFFLGLRLGLSWVEAALASLFFGIHPMHVESVAWVTERKDVLYAFFYVWALYDYWRYLETGRKVFYLMTLILGVLSLLAKPMAVSLVLILFLLDWFKDRKLSLKIFLEKIPFVICTILIGWMTYRYHARIPVANLEQAFLIWIWTLIFYLRQFLFPFVLIPVYPLPDPISFANPDCALSAVALLILLIFLYRHRKNRWLIFASVYFLASIFFLLRMDVKWDMNIVADRFMYLPSLGFCFLLAVYTKKILAWALRQTFLLRGAVSAAVVILLVLMGLKTFLQTRIWKNDEVLWNYVIEKIKMNSIAYVAYNNRGIMYVNQKQMALALEDFNRSIQVNPATYYLSYYNRGNVYCESGYYQLAVRDFTSALSINPQYDRAYNNRGLVFSAFGEDQNALADFYKCIIIKPDEARYYHNRGDVFKKIGQANLAERDFQRAKELGWQE